MTRFIKVRQPSVQIFGHPLTALKPGGKKIDLERQGFSDVHSQQRGAYLFSSSLTIHFQRASDQYTMLG